MATEKSSVPPITYFVIAHILMRFMTVNLSDRGESFAQLWYLTQVGRVWDQLSKNVEKTNIV